MENVAELRIDVQNFKVDSICWGSYENDKSPPGMVGKWKFCIGMWYAEPKYLYAIQKNLFINLINFIKII